MGDYAPYHDFVDSGVAWIGELPDHWSIKRLKYVTQCLDRMRIPLNASERGEKAGGIPYWGANGVLGHVDEFLLDEELVLLGEDGAPFFDKCKPVAFRVDGPIWPNNHVHVLRPLNICAQWLTYCLNITEYANYIDGSTRDKLVQASMNDIPIAFPPLPEQRAIARFLDHKTAQIDALIAKKEALLARLADKRTALISHAVTKGLDPDAPMIDSGIEWLGEIPSHWEVVRLRFLMKETLANGLFKKKEFWGSGTRIVNVFDVYIRGDIVNEESLDRVDCTEAEAQKYSADHGDFFFVRSSLKLEGVGKSATVLDPSEPMVFECHLVRGRPDLGQVNPRYLNLFLNSHRTRSDLVSKANQVTMATIDQTKLSDIQISVPCLDEQLSIVTYLEEVLSELDQIGRKTQSVIKRLKDYRTALITHAVTGKIDVRNVPIPESPAPESIYA